ncbi:MAG: hypothetical protein ACOX4R_00575 [Lentihominibacter sp.]|jgi:DNA-directed RNA polymerase subunit RPC12/RpoP
MSDVIEYKCPNCGGAIAFNIATQNLKCPFCDTEYELEALKAYDDSLKKEADDFVWNTEAGGQWTEGETAGLKVYICQSCAGEIVGDDTLGSSRCPYCDSTIVMKEQFAGDLKPDYVIPFKLEKEEAKKAFAEHLLGKKLLDRRFVDENKIDEIKGVYVPFWLFDTALDADVSYKCSNSKSSRSGDYIITKTDYYLCNVEGSMGFDRIPVDGSSKMADDLMESLEPFDSSDAVPFQTAYMAGYMANRYDVELEESIDNINRRVKGSAEDVFMDQVTGFETKTVSSSRIKLKDSESKYALYPIWTLKINWKGKLYTFAMNGQTGKFVGDQLPENKAKSRMVSIVSTVVGTVAGLVAAFAIGIIF